ncbi:MAG: phosphatase PAP2 family protein [Clostridia bacterium]|nr:phosphatase PAP2 family protein [Clostridia bacterium]
MKKNKKFVLAIVFILLTALVAALVRFVDVAAIGPEGTKIGLSGVNKAVHDLTGVNMTLYKITECLGYAALLLAAAFAAVGLWQLITRRSFSRVDPEILLLGGLYAAVLALYVIFEKVIVNYRPILMPDGEGPEASFPSSHTMLACTILGSAIIVLPKYVKKKGLCTLLQTACAGMMAALVIGRFASGVHWLTDILAGICISTALLLLFSGILERLQAQKGKR